MRAQKCAAALFKALILRFFAIPKVGAVKFRRALVAGKFNLRSNARGAGKSKCVVSKAEPKSSPARSVNKDVYILSKELPWLGW